MDLSEFYIEEDLQWIKSKSKQAFSKLVKEQAQELTLEKNKRVGKMKNLFYSELSLQEYLVDHKITTSQARAIFKFKTRMANFSENFKAGGLTKPCPLCLEAPDTQQHSLVCKIILENISVNTRYEHIFHSKVSEETARTLENILKFRSEYFNQ